MQFSDNSAGGARRIARWNRPGTAAMDDASKQIKDMLLDP